MEDSRLSIKMKPGYFISIFSTCIALAIAQQAAEPCITDKECSQNPFMYERMPDLRGHFRACLNGTCGCPPDHISLTSDSHVYGRIGLCIPKFMDTGKPCGNSGCDTTSEKCLENKNCWKCNSGALSPSTGDCEGPFHGDLCKHSFQGSVDAYGTIRYSMACKDNSDCPVMTRDGSNCACKAGNYYNKADKACTPLPKRGEDCSASQECQDEQWTYGYTKCSENVTCTCKGLTRGDGYCLQWPGGTCDFHSRSDPSQCVPNSKCSNYRCSCDAGFVNNQEGECLRHIFRKKCQPNLSDDLQKAIDFQGLKCINGRFSCAKPLEQVYEGGSDWNEGRHICVIQVGGTCNSTKDKRCTEGASCTDVNGEFKCECNQGYSSTPDNSCLKHVGFGETCNDEDKCNFHAGVVCAEGVCQCPEEFVQFDPVLQRCLSPEGRFCGPALLGDSVSAQIECQAGLKCAKPKGPILTGLRCIKE